MINGYKGGWEWEMDMSVTEDTRRHFTKVRIANCGELSYLERHMLGVEMCIWWIYG